ncbi:MAG: nitrate reductase associated protein [Saprospiraceae bacterium]|nr:nitrate reductase associated protein [Saprospiraceae bacterium]
MNPSSITTQEIAEQDIFCFDFEKEFIVQAIQCIPMIVRYKLDTVGIKLSLAQWSRFSWFDRYQLSILACREKNEFKQYEIFLIELLKHHGWFELTRLPLIGRMPDIPAGILDLLNERLMDLGHQIDEAQWKDLTDLERFALSKLIRKDHESKNLIPALVEFGILKPPG